MPRSADRPAERRLEISDTEMVAEATGTDGAARRGCRESGLVQALGTAAGPLRFGDVPAGCSLCVQDAWPL